MDQEHLSRVDEMLLQHKYQLIDEHSSSTTIHHHNAYEIGLYLKSDNWLFIKDTRYRLGPNTLVFIAPYTLHTLHYTPGTEYQRTILNFEAGFVEPLLQACGCAEVLALFQQGPQEQGATVLELSVASAIKVNRLLSELHLATAAGAAGGRHMARRRLAVATFLLNLHEAYGASAGMTTDAIHNTLVRGVVRYIDEHYADAVSLDVLAEQFYVSKYHLSRLFKGFTGTSVVGYLQHRRVARAQQLLIGSGTTPAELCRQCGFNNIQHFHRVFKKTTGTTPGLWRGGRAGSSQ